MREGTFSTSEPEVRPPNQGTLFFKDEALDALANRVNVAQFVSFGPNLQQRYSRVVGLEPNHRFGSFIEAIQQLLRTSPEGALNIRTFNPESPLSNPLVEDLSEPVVILKKLNEFASLGLYTILNEKIDKNDGGVSGVVDEGWVEFAPRATPRCVERAAAALSLELALKVFDRVYGFVPELELAPRARVEFSIHPTQRGYANTRTVIWEIQEEKDAYSIKQAIRWPNPFSVHLGDKLFGLVLADALGLEVPATLAIPRWLPQFTFGRRTRSSNGIKWLRTCPAINIPGKFKTIRAIHGWADPFELMRSEDPRDHEISSLIVQEAVNAKFSGAVETLSDGSPRIEGVEGIGQEFMLGKEEGKLPKGIIADVREVHRQVHELLGSMRIEWVHDGSRVWVVQLQQDAPISGDDEIFPGNSDTEYIVFEPHKLEPADALVELRRLIANVTGTNTGITVKGHIGLTSHLAQALRKARIPSRRVPFTSQLKMPFQN